MGLGESRFRERRVNLMGEGPLGSLLTTSRLGTVFTYTNGVITNQKNLNLTGVGSAFSTQRCWDNTNIPVRDARGRRGFRSGGRLDILHLRVNPNQSYPVVASNSASNSSTRKEYRGVFFGPTITDDPQFAQYASAGGLKVDSNPLFPTISSSMESAAWNTRPKLERESLANAIYELREVPSLLRQNAKTFMETWDAFTGARSGLRMPNINGAEEFLAYQFGWRPFVNDVQKMLDTALFAKQYIETLKAQNNTWVKVTRTLEEESTTTKLGTYGGYGLQPVGFDIFNLCNADAGGFFGSREVWQDVKRRVWSIGEFKFYRPELDTMNDDVLPVVKLVNQQILVHGLRINPQHIWAAIPWTWLIDWFTNIGDLITRASEQYVDGMVNKYLYVMQAKEITLRSLHTVFFKSGNWTCENVRLISTKQRRLADSPYGFVLGGNLSATQWSILAALGLSRNVRFART